jgi:ADP-ribose pyrophosphatase
LKFDANKFRIEYQEIDGKVRRWEAAQRTTRPSTSAVDAVHIIAKLQKPSGPEILLQKQFRPPLNKVCIEFPAGLVDKNETPEEAAVRELGEETGYVGEIMSDRRGARPIISSGKMPNTSRSFSENKN